MFVKRRITGLNVGYGFFGSIRGAQPEDIMKFPKEPYILYFKLKPFRKQPICKMFIFK